MANLKTGCIVDLTGRFSTMVTELADELEAKRKYTMAYQLYKSGTSVGSIIREAQGSADYTTHCKIAYIEAEEARYWLRSCKQENGLKVNDDLLTGVEEIIKALAKIISSKKTKN